MDQADQNQHAPSPAGRLSESELRYYYFGFHKALKRYRAITIVGWTVVAIGCLSFLMAWSMGRLGGVLGVLPACTTVVAGIGLVSQSVSSLESYLRIALPFVHDGELHPLVHDVVAIMGDVDDGGWQEAYAAIGKMEELGKHYGLPPLG